MAQITCPACYGYGHRHKVLAAGWDADGVPFAFYENCARCGGSGQVAESEHIRACVKCGSPNIVNVTPAFGGLNGYGERCKDCGHFRDISEEARQEAEEEYQRETAHLEQEGR